MTHSSLLFATFNVTDAPIGSSSGIGTWVLFVTTVREGNTQDGAAEGTADSDGTKDGTKLTLGELDGTELTLGELDGNPTQVLRQRRDRKRIKLLKLITNKQMNFTKSVNLQTIT